MNQQKIGEFIAQKRKEKGLTQMELAEILLISNKTISKWECGNGLPEVSLMLPLCNALGISVNELLSGEELKSSYKEKAEENLISLIEDKQKNRLSLNTLLIWQTICLIISIIIWLILFADSNVYQLGQSPTPLTLCYLTVGFVLIHLTVSVVGYAIIKNNSKLVLTALLFASLACLLISLGYKTAWLIIPSLIGVVICFILSLLNLFKKKKS